MSNKEHQCYGLVGHETMLFVHKQQHVRGYLQLFHDGHRHHIPPTHFYNSTLLRDVIFAKATIMTHFVLCADNHSYPKHCMNKSYSHSGSQKSRAPSRQGE
jgi:hypothetical protein